MMKKAALIPDSDLELHISGCYCTYEGVPCAIERINESDRQLRITCPTEGIDKWVSINDVCFNWPDMGYINTATGAVYCQRRAVEGRHYRRAFHYRALDVCRVNGGGLQNCHIRGPNSERDIVYQLYLPSYPDWDTGVQLLVTRLRPAIAISKEVALALDNKGDIRVQVNGTAVGSLDYNSGDIKALVKDGWAYIEQVLEEAKYAHCPAV